MCCVAYHAPRRSSSSAVSHAAATGPDTCSDARSSAAGESVSGSSRAWHGATGYAQRFSRRRFSPACILDSYSRDHCTGRPSRSVAAAAAQQAGRGGKAGGETAPAAAPPAAEVEEEMGLLLEQLSRAATFAEMAEFLEVNCAAFDGPLVAYLLFQVGAGHIVTQMDTDEKPPGRPWACMMHPPEMQGPLNCSHLT